jgi:hypothetical protein
MGVGAFLKRRRDRILNAVLNLAPGPIARTVDQARSRRRHEELADRVDALVAELEEPMTYDGQRLADDERRRRDASARNAEGDHSGGY